MKVMIIDNDREFTEELADVLRAAGYEIEAFVDSVLALNAVHWVQPSVILLDLMLRKINGYQAAWYLRKFQETASIPIIGMSGYAGTTDPLRLAAWCGMRTFLKKPFYPLDIIARIEQHASIIPMAMAAGPTIHHYHYPAAAMLAQC